MLEWLGRQKLASLKDKKLVIPSIGSMYLVDLNLVVNSFSSVYTKVGLNEKE